MSKWYLYYPSRLKKNIKWIFFLLLFNGIISISTYKKVATVVFYIELFSRNLTLPNYAKFFGAFRGSGTQIPRLTNPIFAFSKTLVLVPISSSKTCRLQNFLKLFSSPVVFLWVTSRVGCLIKAINIPIFVYSIMSSDVATTPIFPHWAPPGLDITHQLRHAAQLCAPTFRGSFG